MAAKETQRRLSASIAAGSEEQFDFCCEPCDLDNRHLEAVGYCQQCNEYLCDSCYTYHSKLSATRSHKLLDKAAMPKTKPSPKVKDVLIENCSKHTDKLLEYFCKGHNQLCCSVCLNTEHKACSDTPYIPDISDEFAKSSEYRRIAAELARLVAMANIQQQTLLDRGKENDKYRSQAVIAIKRLRKQINELLDKLEKEAEQKVMKLDGENRENLKTASEKCQSLFSEVTSLKSNIDNKATAGKNNQLFVQVNQIQQSISGIEEHVHEFDSCTISRYTFLKDDKVRDLMSTLSALWSLSVKQSGEVTKARYLREVSVESEEDTEDCSISGIAVLSGGRMVMADNNNKAVKLIGVTGNKMLFRVALSSAPWGITETEPDHVAVSLGEENKIEIYKVSDSLSLCNTINLADGDRFWGLCYDGERFIIPFLADHSIKVVDMTGQVLRTVYTDTTENPLFDEPLYITIGHGNDVVYITDFKTHNVTTMTLSGQIVSVYKSDMLKSPTGVAVDGDGSVYVCSHDTDTVHQLSPSGRITQILLGEDQGLVERPEAIAYSKVEGVLYISSDSDSPNLRNKVQVFQLE